MHVRLMHVADKFCLTGLKAHATEKYVNSLGNICHSSYLFFKNLLFGKS